MSHAKPLHRIADALDRLSPPPPEPADPLAHPAYVWRHGALVAARSFRPLALGLLTGIDAQKAALLANTRRLAAGHAAHDALLWGARGTGKSALAKAVVGAVRDEGAMLALVEVAGDALATLPRLFALLAPLERAFVLFLDDLGFADESEAPRLLRSLLEGGAEARPDNARLYVTANRRNIVSRDMGAEAAAVNPRDATDDRLALADRFGLSLGFHAIDQDAYLAMIAGYAEALGLGAIDAGDAIGWATTRGSRSGRVAWQYVTELAGRRGRRA